MSSRVSLSKLFRSLHRISMAIASALRLSNFLSEPLYRLPELSVSSSQDLTRTELQLRGGVPELPKAWQALMRVLTLRGYGTKLARHYLFEQVSRPLEGDLNFEGAEADGYRPV